MKRTFFYALMIGAALVSCKKDDKKDNTIDFEKEFTELYALGGAVNKWDAMDPEPMKLASKDNFVIEVDLIKCNENKLIKFCMTSGKPWNETDFLVPAAVEADKQYAFLKEGVNKLQHTSEKLDGEGNLKDWFFGLEAGKSGKYRLTVNPRDLTCTAEKLSELPDKAEVQWQEGMVYMVGDATPAGWDINGPTEMVKNGDVFTYEGPLAVGQMKFPVEFRWDGPTYLSVEDELDEINDDKTEGSTHVAAGQTYKVQLSPEGKPDFKFKILEAGEYKITLDTKALTLKVEVK